MSNLYRVDFIHSSTHTDLSLCINYDLEKNHYYAVGLNFGNGIVWDNELYIYNEFKKFLFRYQERQILDADFKEYEDIYDLLSDEYVETLLNILKEGEKLGWNNLTKNYERN